MTIGFYIFIGIICFVAALTFGGLVYLCKTICHCQVRCFDFSQPEFLSVLHYYYFMPSAAAPRFWRRRTSTTTMERTTMPSLMVAKEGQTLWRCIFSQTYFCNLKNFWLHGFKYASQLMQFQAIDNNPDYGIYSESNMDTLITDSNPEYSTN